MKAQVRVVSTIPSVLMCFAPFFPIAARAQDSHDIPTVLQEIKHDLGSRSLRDMAKPALVSTGNRQLGQPALQTHSPFKSSETDSVAQVPAGAPVSVATSLDFDGLDAAQTVASGGPFVPPDTNGAVGATQFVEWVNVTFEVFDKTTGAVVMGPTPGNAFWKGFGGACEARNDGDIIIQYDKQADRWVAAQPVFAPPFMYCLAVSTTSDATGFYNRYAFSFPSPNTSFPDYPKLGVWPDGYYVTANIFSPHFSGAMACALDRANMLAGHAAKIVCFQESPNVSSLLPADLDGRTPPPAGSPNFMVGLADATDLNFFRFHVDFGNPANSTFIGPTLIPVAPFAEPCSLSTRACITEPNPGEKVDSLGDRVMYRLAYRNFGDHEALVVNHTIEGGAEAGVRWYEIRNPSSSPFVFQQGTVIDPNINYWMGSIAMDAVGNIALGFSASSSGLFPSVAVVGRVPTDPLGTMEAPTFLVTGGGVQVQSFRRWGDYSSMSVDPKDDCTFWYAQEYMKTTGSFNWSTRIASFKFNSCE
ncbi:MAG TPA: hypothetical protein VGZ22_18885 [Isosphaeraceae bacterium]|jgi:hypothetical protein|nr:hypothetical protein [Isosphaeraceae bacterium]